MKEFLFHSTCHCHCQVRNGNLLKSRVSEICIKRIGINQGVGVFCKFDFYSMYLEDGVSSEG